MLTFIEILQAVGAFMIGLAGRTALFLVGAVILVIPAAIIAVGINAVRARRERSLARVGNVTYREGAYFAPNHTWLAPTSAGDVDVGIDEVAKKIIPSSTSVEVAAPGTSVRKGETVAVVYAGRHAVPISAPVDGKVTRVNGAIAGNPALVREESYGRGWLFTLAPADNGYLRFPAGYEAAGWLGEEKARLARFVERELGIAAADGGDLRAPLPSALGEKGWRKVVTSFLG